MFLLFFLLNFNAVLLRFDKAIEIEELDYQEKEEADNANLSKEYN